MVNKHKVGATVYAKVYPSQALIVRRFIKEIYYCQRKDDLTAKELVYFERELIPNHLHD
jgi:deoxycytidylate deaminase